MDEVVFDIETDGLLKGVSKIHCLSYSVNFSEPKTLFKREDIQDFLVSNNNNILIGHHIIGYDLKALIRLGFGWSKQGKRTVHSGKLIDTLPLSYYLNTNRKDHGLESFGVDYGIPKPKVTDWENLTPEEYQHRCEEDVKINIRLYKDLKAKLQEIYT